MNMQITVGKLQEMIKTTVTRKLSENYKPLTEGTKEIPIRMVLDDIKEIIVDSITEDLVRELNVEEMTVSRVVSQAFDTMTRQIVLGLDEANKDAQSSGPRRRIVATR